MADEPPFDSVCDWCGAPAVVAVSGSGFPSGAACIEHVENIMRRAGDALRRQRRNWEARRG